MSSNFVHNFTLCHLIWCTTLRCHQIWYTTLRYVIKFGTHLYVMSSNLVHNFTLCHQIWYTTLRYVIKLRTACKFNTEFLKFREPSYWLSANSQWKVARMLLLTFLFRNLCLHFHQTGIEVLSKSTSLHFTMPR